MIGIADLNSLAHSDQDRADERAVRESPPLVGISRRIILQAGSRVLYGRWANDALGITLVAV
jgi:hypothetical protein